MIETKYGKHIVHLDCTISRYKGRAPDFSIRARADGERLGFDFHLGFGHYKGYKKFGESPYYIPHNHRYDEVLLWIGANPDDISELGSESEIYLGKEGEKHLINTPSAVVCPVGFLHLPLTITKVDRPFLWGLLCFSSSYLFTRMRLGWEPVNTNGTKYSDHISEVPFSKEHRGSNVAPTWKIEGLRHHNLTIEYMICKEPFRFGKEPYTPNVHDFDEILLFLSNDPDDVTELGGEAEISLGKEEEKHLIRIPTAVAVPRGMPHLPLTITKVDKPFMFIKASFAEKDTPINLP